MDELKTPELLSKSYYGNLEESEDIITLWVTNNVRFALTAVSLSAFVIFFIWSWLVVFIYPDTKKIEHRTIVNLSFILLGVAGAGCFAVGKVVEHDAPLLIMERERKRKHTAYKIAVNAEIAKRRELAKILPQNIQQVLPQAQQPIQALPPQIPVQQSAMVVAQPTAIQTTSNNQPVKINYQSLEYDDEIENYDYPLIEVNGRKIDKIIYDLAGCRNSIFLSSKPGTGKTTITLAWLWCVLNRYPETSFIIIGQKRDHWLGLGEIPGVLTVVGTDTKKLFSKVDSVVKTLKERCQTPEHERNFKNKPIKILFDDYTSIYSSVKAEGDKVLKQFIKDMNFIITVGREFNVSAYISAHSFNLKNVGLEGTDIRDCLALMCLGFDSLTDDGKSGGFESIETVLKNQHIIKNNNERAELYQHYLLLKEIASDENYKRQVLFCTLGGTQVGLLSDLRWVKEDETVIDAEITGDSYQDAELEIETKNKILQSENNNSEIAKKIILKKKSELDISSVPGGTIDDIYSWLRVDFPDKLNLMPAKRPGLYAMMVDDVPIYIGKSNDLYRRLNIDKHHKVQSLFEAKEKGLKIEVAFFSCDVHKDENPAKLEEYLHKWEEYLYNFHECKWNGNSDNAIPQSIDEKLQEQDLEIYEFCFNRYTQNPEPVKVRDIQRDAKLVKKFNLNSEKIKKSFERLVDLKLGEIVVEKIGGTESVQFKPEV